MNRRLFFRKLTKTTAGLFVLAQAKLAYSASGDGDGDGDDEGEGADHSGAEDDLIIVDGWIVKRSQVKLHTRKRRQ